MSNTPGTWNAAAKRIPPAANGWQTAAVRPSWPRVFAALLALVFLNGLLSFGPWWPTPGIVLQARLAPEFVGLWLLLLWLVSRPGVPSRRTLWGLSVAVLVLVLGRYADVTAPSLFGRPISLYW
ncbi:MAG: hypothetical protein WEK74_09395, partial [Hydrogenophaga sp.]